MTQIMASVRGLLRPAHWTIASILPLEIRRHYLHLAGTGRWGNFKTPQTFNEKINWRILNDRRPRIVAACDKLAMKESARNLVPDANVLRIPRTLWAGTDLAEAPLQTDQPWIIKPNHGSGMVLKSDQADEKSLKACHDWLVSAPAEQLGEWGYAVARPLLLMEELIPSPDGGLTDYKFHVFDGVPRFVEVNRGRFSQTPTLAFYDPDGRLLPLRDTRWPHPGDDSAELPFKWAEMVRLAIELAAGWDHIRVDLYSVGDDIWFGEYCPYPCGGVATYRPSGSDRRIGEWWTLPTAAE